MPVASGAKNRWFYLLFKKRLTASLFVIIPLVVALTAFASGFIALVLVDHYLIDARPPLVPISRTLILDLVGQIKIVVLGFTVLGLFVGGGIAYAILQPLKRIIAEARQIAGGDFSGRLDIENMGELGILGKDFNKMVSSLNKYFIDSMAGGWILLNREGRIVSVNPGALSILECDEDALIGQPLDRLYQFINLGEEMTHKLNDAVFHQKVFVGQGLQAITGENHRVTLSLSTSLLKDKDDIFVGVAATIKDLDRAKELTEQMHRTDKLASMGAMAAALAHEIRNPLGSIRGLTQLLEEEFREDEKGKTYTRTMIKEIDRLNGVVSNLLNFAQPGNLQIMECDVNDLLEEALALARLETDKKKIVVEKKLLPSLPKIWVEGQQLVQAFLNLLLNAAQATEMEGKIQIVTELRAPQSFGSKNSSAGDVVIRIKNTGQPIDASIQKRIFDPFFTTKESGTGLGLAITHQIVTLNHGSIGFSREGNFTVCTLGFPIGNFEATKILEAPVSRSESGKVQ